MKQNLDEALFPGNEVNFAALQLAASSGDLLIITGAGVSTPALPLWNEVICDLAALAAAEGKCTVADKEYIVSFALSDPLAAANLLQDVLGTAKLTTELAKIFGPAHHVTSVQKKLISLPALAHLTLNYDRGLTNAFVELHGEQPEILHPSDPYNLDQIAKLKKNLHTPIIHWHGTTTMPHSIIFSHADYAKFYGSPSVQSILPNLFRSKRILFVGFGFTDPYLMRFLSDIGFDAASADNHFAIVSESDPSKYSPLRRKGASLLYKSGLIVYDSSNGHSKLELLIDYLLDSMPTPAQETTSKTPTPLESKKTIQQHLSDKLLNSQNNPLYVEPIFRKRAPGTEEDILALDEELVTLADIVAKEVSTIITAPHEYGLSTAGDVIEFELLKRDISVLVRSADGLASYEAKLRGDLRTQGASYEVLILDNVRPNHSKLILAIVRLGIFKRIIILAHEENIENHLDLSIFENIEQFRLLPLSRESLSALAAQIAPQSAQGRISLATEKVYRDLLQLAIPMTPANVVMYLSVVFRDYDFSPLSRLQIIERYLDSRLARASDAYSDSFNSTNKIDLVAQFAFSLFRAGASTFTVGQWDEFCIQYKSSKLITFQHSDLIRDLEDSRVIIRQLDNSTFLFSYRIFFAYFIGKHIADRPDELARCIQSGEYLSMAGLIEVITGISKDNSFLLDDVTSRMERAIDSFYEKFPIRDFDIHRKLTWERSQESEHRDWLLVEQSLQEGPVNQALRDTAERDRIDELRSERQGVTINTDILNANGRVSDLLVPIMTAVSNSIDVSGELKTRAYKASLVAHRVAFQIACLWAPKIAENRITIVEGLGFINLKTFDAEDSQLDRAIDILAGLPLDISLAASRYLASRKLGEVFKMLAVRGGLEGFDRLLNFALLIRSRPLDWEKVSANVIEQMGSKELYLRYSRRVLLNEFKTGICTGGELEAIKRLVARIHTRRDIGKNNAGPKSISKAVASLEQSGAFKIDN
jgi:hypothetical protein